MLDKNTSLLLYTHAFKYGDTRACTLTIYQPDLVVDEALLTICSLFYI